MDRCAFMEEEVIQAMDEPTGGPQYDGSGAIVVSASIRRDSTIGVHYRFGPEGERIVHRVFNLQG